MCGDAVEDSFPSNRLRFDQTVPNASRGTGADVRPRYRTCPAATAKDDARAARHDLRLAVGTADRGQHHVKLTKCCSKGFADTISVEARRTKSLSLVAKVRLSQARCAPGDMPRRAAVGRASRASGVSGLYSSSELAIRDRIFQCPDSSIRKALSTAAAEICLILFGRIASRRGTRCWRRQRSTR